MRGARGLRVGLPEFEIRRRFEWPGAVGVPRDRPPPLSVHHEQPENRAQVNEPGIHRWEAAECFSAEPGRCCEMLARTSFLW